MRKMEGESFSESLLSNVKESSRSEKKKMKKEKRKHKAIEIGNAESKDTEVSVGTDSNLGSEANVSNSLTKDAHFETEESTHSRRKKRKMKVSSVIDEKQTDSCKESGLKETKGTVSEGYSNVGNVENNIGLESGLKGSRLKEQQEHSERKGKRKKKRTEGLESVVESSEPKVSVSLESGLKEGANSDRGTLDDISLESGLKGTELNEQMVQLVSKNKKRREKQKRKKLSVLGDSLESVLELIDSKENPLVNEKQGDCHVESKVSESLESRLKEGANSDRGTLGDISLESGLKETQLNEQMVQLVSKSNKERKRMKKLRDSLESVLELRDSKENPSVNEKQDDCHVEPKLSVSLESGLKEGANSDRGTLGDISFESGLEETQLNEKMVQLVSKSKKKTERKKRKRRDSLESDLELRYSKENSSVNEKQGDCHVGPKLSVSLESGWKEGTTSDGVLTGHAMPAQVLEEAIGNCTGSEAAVKRRKKMGYKLKKQKDAAKDDDALKATAERNSLSCRIGFFRPKKKLLVLDMNGILADVVPQKRGIKPDFSVSQKAVFKRPFCDDFLNFCFSTFEVGIWSSRLSNNLNRMITRIMDKWRHDLLFCWHRKQCTITKFKTIEDKGKPLVLKELRRLWEKKPFHNLPGRKGEYDKSNTFLLDDSPYKALLNPANTGIFPYPYQYTNAEDSSLGPGGDIRKYLEGLAAAENVQKYVEQNPFGQPAITKSDPHWDFYCQIVYGNTEEFVHQRKKSKKEQTRES